MKLRRVVVTSGATLAIITALYLFLWPVPIDPVAWEAPVNRGFVDPFAPNNRLQMARLIDLGEHEGPEDIAGGPDGQIYTGTSDGKVLRFDTSGSNIEILATTGGRPLGMEFDNEGRLVVANGYQGLERVSPDGTVEILTDQYGGEKIGYADDAAVAQNGTIYFSDASVKFGVSASGGSYEASLLDIMEHGAHGRVLSYDPASGTTSVLVDGLNFANGVAISEDQQYLLINETGTYRVLRYWLEGPEEGSLEVVIDNLPGFPDNINAGLNGKFWVGLVAPRSSQLDGMSDKPWLRKLVQRLPAALRPKAVPSSHVIAINGDGDVLMNLQDPEARLPAITGVYESRDTLWLSSLFGHKVGRLDKRDLASP